MLNKQINVSVEAWEFQPASLVEIEAIIHAGPQELRLDVQSAYDE